MSVVRYAGALLPAIFAGSVVSSTVYAELFQPGAPGCEKCAAGEYLLRIYDTVPPGGNYVHVDDPPCRNAKEINEQLATAIASAPSSENKNQATGELNAVAKGLGISGGTLGKIYADYAGLNTARCHPVCVTVPEGAQVTGLSFYMKPWNSDGLEKCQIGNKCAGFARVFNHVQTKQSVCVVVSNWSHNLERPVRMDVWFKSNVPPVEYR